MWAKSIRYWDLILIFGLGLSIAPWTFGVTPQTRKHGNRGDVCVQSTRLRNSQENTPVNQVEARPDLLIVQAPEVRPGLLSQRFPQGGRLVRLAPSDQTPRCLSPDFFAAADPRTSFDGARVLFSGKRTADSLWQVWEINMDGSGVRQATHCPDDCLKPAYLPRGEIVYTAISGGAARSGLDSSNTQGTVPSTADSATRTGAASQLWVSKVDGADAHPITFGPGDFQVETVLKNGMILATARSPLLPSNGLPGDRQLYTLRPDGTGLSTLRCDHEHPAIRRQAEELDDGTVVFVKSALNSRSLGGDLAWIRRGALRNAPLTTPPILASSPQPITANELLVTREFPPGLTTEKKLTLYVFDTAMGRFVRPIYEGPEPLMVESVPVAAHEPPRWYWSTLNPEVQRGYFVCLDGYLAEGLPQGRIATKLTRVRVLTLDVTTQRVRLLGEAPMEEDGSFYIAVPPDKPVRFEVLDAAGRVVRAQRSWIWSRSGEEHGCVGCHEDHALAPENRWPMALRRFDTPTRLDLTKRPASAH